MDDNLSQILQRACLQSLEKIGAAYAAASIKKPIHNVKYAGKSRKYREPRPEGLATNFVSSSLEYDQPSRVKLVEPSGIEPLTPCLQSRCSPS